MARFDSLPREVKDMIYGPLVSFGDGDHLPEVNILSVSKQMREEALEEMMASSGGGFVKVSYDDQDLQSALEGFGVPFVSDDPRAIANFPHHCVEVHIRTGNVSSGLPSQERILLLRDIKVFTDVLRSVLYGCQPHASPSMKTGCWTSPKAEQGTGALIFSFPTTTSSYSQGAAQELQLLKHFRKCCSGKHDVIIYRTALDLRQCLSFKRSVAPARIWLDAAAWSYLQCLIRCKKRVNDLYNDGQLARVRKMTTQILTLWRSNMLRSHATYSMYMDEGKREPLARIGLVLLDLTVCAFAACVKMHDVEGMEQILKAQRSIHSHLLYGLSAPSPLFVPAARGLISHVGQKWCLLLLSELVTDGDFWGILGGIHDSMPIVSEPLGVYLHDAEVMQKLYQKRGQARHPHHPLAETFGVDHVFEQLSVNVLPIKASEFDSSIYDFVMPEGCDGEGWVNTVEETKLAEEERKDDEMRRERGLEPRARLYI